jgi:hypothetical protein
MAIKAKYLGKAKIINEKNFKKLERVSINR